MLPEPLQGTEVQRKSMETQESAFAPKEWISGCIAFCRRV